MLGNSKCCCTVHQNLKKRGSDLLEDVDLIQNVQNDGDARIVQEIGLVLQEVRELRDLPLRVKDRNRVVVQIRVDVDLLEVRRQIPVENRRDQEVQLLEIMLVEILPDSVQEAGCSFAFEVVNV